MVQHVDPLGVARSFEYDEVGNLIASTNRNGLTRQFTYNELNLLPRNVGSTDSS